MPRLNGRTCALFVLLGLSLGTPPTDAGYCWGWSTFGATNPQSWACGVCDDGICPGDVLGQTIRHEHRNWHCSNPVVFNEPYGRRFLAFHRQFILDFENWRLANTTLGRFETWDASQNLPVPGDEETTTSAFTHCSTGTCTSQPCYCSDDETTLCNNDGDCPGTCEDIRPAGTQCTNCQDLPSAFTGSNLGLFNSLGEVGYNLEQSWHGSYHNGVRVLGCQDVGTSRNTSHDPAFWMAHKKLDEVARDWQALQATDVVIVVDRSGSMDDNCSSTSPPLNESPCAINDARRAAFLFAKIVEDVRMDSGSPASQQHRIGLVSFAGSSSPGIGLTAANGIATGNLTGDTGFEAALIGLSTGGSTSIASGIREAISILNAVPDPNPHRAILVLTDGKENVAPCLEGATSPCVTGDVLTEGEVGDIQIVAIGVAEGAEENHLRDVAERHGGIFVAQGDVNDDLGLTKFYVTAFGELYDEAVAIDPKGTIPSGASSSDPFPITICDETKLSVVVGYEDIGPECDLFVELTTPSGNVVDRSDPRAETGHSGRHDFLRLQLPYEGESTGTWSARIVRSGQAGNCTRQTYFYSVLADGLGRIDPFVKRPDVVVGRNVLATFRITESNRPDDDWDAVNAEVTLFRQDGAPETLPLFDDGTNGDRIDGNNVWTAEFQNPVLEPGIYHLRGRFELTEGQCTKVRESEYSIVALPQPEECSRLVCNPFVKARAGEVRPLGEQWCAWNRCGQSERYVVSIADEKNWLKTIDPGTGALVDLPPDFLSEGAPPFDHDCFGASHGEDEGTPQIFIAIPAGTPPGEVSPISVQVSPAIGGGQQPLGCETSLLVLGPPDCNMNGRDDAIDLAEGTSEDLDGDGNPDECNEAFHPPQVSLDLGEQTVDWESLGTVAYDVVRGDLGKLRESDGDYVAATSTCVAEDLLVTSLSHGEDPPPGEGVWFLVRYALPAGNGSYRSGGPNEVAGRDEGITQSGVGCR